MYIKPLLFWRHSHCIHRVCPVAYIHFRQPPKPKEARSTNYFVILFIRHNSHWKEVDDWSLGQKAAAEHERANCLIFLFWGSDEVTRSVREDQETGEQVGSGGKDVYNLTLRQLFTSLEKKKTSRSSHNQSVTTRVKISDREAFEDSSRPLRCFLLLCVMRRLLLTTVWTRTDDIFL